MAQKHYRDSRDKFEAVAEEAATGADVAVIAYICWEAQKNLLG
jgi:hypothetical protein